mgnify:CR=1 FL=1
MGVYDKLLAIQAELKAPKGQYNSFGKYNYRSCEDILEAVKPLCKAHNALVMISDELEYINGRFYVKAVATFADAETGENVYVSAYAREADSKKGMDESQVTGTASSYARKYALNGLFCIDDAKDADTDAYGRQTGKAGKQADKPPVTPTPPPAVVKCKDCGKPVADVEWSDGSKTSAKKMVNQTIQRYGVALCGDCYTVRRAKEQTDGNQS